MTMLRLNRNIGLGTEVDPEKAPEPLPTLSLPVLSAQDQERAKALYLCPHWQRLTARGTCVDNWWVGPPLSWVSAALITTIGMGLIGWALVAASKVKALQPAVSRVRRVVKAPTWE